MPLTAREQQVYDRLLRGATSKEIARDLGLSWRTIEIHRGHVLAKLNARNTIDLVLKTFNREAASPDPASQQANLRSHLNEAGIVKTK